VVIEMKNFIITVSVNSEIINRIFDKRDRIYLDKIENMNKLIEEKHSGKLYLDEENEEFYFYFLTGQENISPAVLRCFYHGIKIEENQTPFLARFFTQYNDIITRIDVDLSIEEKRHLLNELKEKFDFNYYIKERDIIIIFDFKFPYFRIPIPEEIEGKNIKKIIPDKNDLLPLKNFILITSEVLEKSIINQIRKDLNQSVANLLYLWGYGQLNEIQNLKKRMNCYYMKFENGKYEEIATTLGFNKINNFCSPNENSLYWLTFSPDDKNSSIQLKKLENFDKKVLGEILKEKDIKVLIIFESDENTQKYFNYVYFTDTKKEKKFLKRKIRNISYLHSLFFNNGKNYHWFWK